MLLSGRTRFLLATAEEVDVIISFGGASQDHPMRMEGCSGNRGPLVLLEEAGMRLYTRQFLTVEVEDLDKMCRCATVRRARG
jgi:hypothetical protein